MDTSAPVPAETSPSSVATWVSQFLKLQSHCLMEFLSPNCLFQGIEHPLHRPFPKGQPEAHLLFVCCMLIEV